MSKLKLSILMLLSRLQQNIHQRNKRPHYHPLNPAKSGGGTQKKVNSMVLFDQETNNKLRSEAPMFKLINQSLLFCWRFPKFQWISSYIVCVFFLALKRYFTDFG
ncbi:hypothetical protein Bca101_009063 [Brassica carinata]